jgi:hypothetical protein
LSSAFGYGTPAYLRYNEAATLDPSPLLADVAVRAPARPIGGTVRHEAKVQETTRQQFQRTRSGRSLCSGKRSAHSKTKSPRQGLSQRRPHRPNRRCRTQRPSRRQSKFGCSNPGVGAASPPKLRGVACDVGGEDAIDEPTRPTGVDRFYTFREPCNALVIECTMQASMHVHSSSSWCTVHPIQAPLIMIVPAYC